MQVKFAGYGSFCHSSSAVSTGTLCELPCHTGVVNGVQCSLQSMFQSLSYVVGLVFWRPLQFSILMYASAIVVLLAASLYTVFVCCSRVNGLQQ